MRADLSQEQNPEQASVLPVLPSVAREGLVWELFCSRRLSLPSSSPAATVECLLVFICTLVKGKGLRLSSWLVLICLKTGKKHFMVWCFSFPVDKHGLIP